ncbi:unnamed protein product [Clavelina lepadiformis]|uniref:Equilibrative nucleoside transporter 1 n=1 Tax=Clavelina lepadiformis TaxID=159417 RepID=A0ABP0FD02_CLALP
MNHQVGNSANADDNTNVVMQPKDRYHFVYAAFYIIGIGGLLPWNFFITANEYWMFKFRNSSMIPVNMTGDKKISEDVQYTYLQNLFENALSICGTVSSLISQFLIILFLERTNEKIRILGSLICQIIFFIITVALVKVDTTKWQQAFFIVTMILIVALNSGSAVFQSSIFAIVSGMPSKYVQAIMAGQGISGIFASVAMIFAIGFSKNPTSSAFAYFLIATGVLVVTLLCYASLSKNVFYLHHYKLNKNPNKGHGHLLNNNEARDQVFVDENFDNDLEPLLSNAETTQTETFPPLWYIFKKTFPHCLSLTLIFFVTLACFPSITASTQSMSQKSTWSTLYFSPVCCFLLYNATDWIGRTTAGYWHYPSEKQTSLLVFLVILRVAFMPLFALCNVQPRTRLPVIFNNDAYFIVFMAIFGLSNGHLSTLSMQYGPRLVEKEHTGIVGTLLVFAICVGLTAGAGFSFALRLAI